MGKYNTGNMGNLKLKEYLNLCSKAKAKVVCKEGICELISFNNFELPSKLQKYYEKKSQAAFFEFIDNVASLNVDIQTFLLCIHKQLKQSLRHFYEKDYFAMHEKFRIIDIDNNQLSFDDMSLEVKTKISGFINIQYTGIKSLFDKMELSSNKTFDTHIKWLASKTDLIEMSIALYDGGFVGADNRKLSKNEFMQHMAVITGIDLQNYEQTFYKVKSRENRTRFLDRLRSVIENMEF